jgi:hypothetical protein
LVFSYVELCKLISTDKIAPPKLPNYYVFIEKLTIPAISFYKDINHKNYIEQKKEKLELLEKKNDEKDIFNKMIETESNLMYCLPSDLKIKIL